MEVVMELTVNELAHRLEVPRITLERWIRTGKIPVQLGDDGCVFDPTELEEWARMHDVELSYLAKLTIDAPPPADDTIQACIGRGAVHRLLVGDDLDSVLRAAVRQAPVDDDAKPDLLRRLLEREELSSTALGCGTAVPHPRSPLGDDVAEPTITVYFLDHPVPWRALDNQPVSTLFLLLSPTVKAHLRLLARLGHCLRDADFCSLLARAPATDHLMEAISRIENGWG